MKYGVLAFVLTLSLGLKAQMQTHLVTLIGDSILYSNSKFKFVEFIDARNDTTKLGFLKENSKAADNQIIDFPEDITLYLPSFINSVTDFAKQAENVCIVIKEFSLSEEPLGTIEILKTSAVIHFYLIKDEKYRLIKKANFTKDYPASEVTDLISAHAEICVRTIFHDFLTNPGSEGENMNWYDKIELLELEIPKNRIRTATKGELTFSKRKFFLNRKPLTKKQALDILVKTGDSDIQNLIKKGQRNKVVGLSFSALAAALAGYPILDKALSNEGEFKGNYIMYGTASAFVSLIASYTSLQNIRDAIEIYNKRYNS